MGASWVTTYGGWILTAFTAVIGLLPPLIRWIESFKEIEMRIAAYITTAALLIFIVFVIFKHPDGAGEWGDLIGGLFSMPALVWFIAAVFLQKKELQLQREELHLTREETARIAKATDIQSKAIISGNRLEAIGFLSRKLNKKLPQ